MLFMVAPHTHTPNYNNRVKITNIDSNSNSFIYIINHSYSFSVYLFIHLFIHVIFQNSLNLFLCRHLAIKSHLWFNSFPGSKYNIICIFSSRHKLHLPSQQLGVDLFSIFHWIFGVKPIFFIFQKCLDKAVWFLKRSLEHEWIWLLYPNFHLTDEIPV